MRSIRLYIIFMLMLFFPLSVYANEPGVTCTNEEMLEMQKEIKDVVINVELMPEGSKIDSFYVDSVDISNTFKVSTKNLPQGYRINIYSDENRTINYGITNESYSIIRDGGVYVVDFRNSKCGLGIIKSYEMMIPYFNANNKDDVWFDGTYSYSPQQNKKNTYESVSIRLIILLLTLIAVVTISILLLFKKNKVRINFNVLVFIIVSLLFIGGVNNVYATNYEIDSGGSPKNPGGRDYDDIRTCQGDNCFYIFTGVGFKVNLVNVNNMYSVSDFIVLRKGQYSGNAYSTWYYFAQEAAKDEGVYGKIGSVYSTSTTKYNNCGEISADSRCVFANDGWFLITPSSNAPNISSSKITEKLFTKSGSKYNPTSTLYEYLLKLLKGYEGSIGINPLSNTDDVKKLLNDSSKLEERKKLQDYRIIVEPLYVAGYTDGRNVHKVYTVKAAFNLSNDVKISYQQDFEENFYALNKHGQINNPFNDNVKDSKSGYGYVIYAIVEEDEACDPKTECCFDSQGNYKKHSDGAYISSNYSCPSGIVGTDNRCTTSVVACGGSSTCEDTLAYADCSGSEGTAVEFHENDKLASCTIPKGNNSGFTIVEQTDTHNYCEVACKDDIDILLPTEKKTLNGSYFKLDQYTPEIKAKRTCVTTSVDHMKFGLDLLKQQEKIADAYNIWQDWVYINGANDSALYDGGPSYIVNPYKEEFVECGCYHMETVGESEEKVCEGDYTIHYWKITPSNGPNGKINYSQTEGSYKTGCEETDDTSKSVYNGTIYNPMLAAEAAYSSALQEYSEMINAYNRCYGWADNTKNTLVVSGAHEHHISVLDERANEPYRKSFEYIFKPDVKYQYQEEGKYWYPTEYTFVYDKDVTYIDTVEKKYDSNILPVTSKTYWAGNANNNTDDYYETGNKSAMPEIEDALLIDCEGTTCSPGDLKIPTKFFKNKYVLRNESYDYIYHLPVLSTVIPNGLVKKLGNYNDYNSPKDVNKNANEILLIEDDSFINAAPVSIKTDAGVYEYKLSVENLIYKKLTSTGTNGDLRYRKQSKNPDDNFESRFIGSKVLSGNGDDGRTYVCTYEVINDIYNPDPENPKNGKNMYFYRPVEITQINPLGREIGYNWADERAKIVKKSMNITGNNYQLLTDGNNGQSDKFEFTLTPTMMNSIRMYNKLHDYSSFDLICSDTEDKNYHCSSKFLECLTSLSSIASSGNLCNNILEGSNLNIKTDYDYEDLINNRTILINKHISLQNEG